MRSVDKVTLLFLGFLIDTKTNPNPKTNRNLSPDRGNNTNWVKNSVTVTENLEENLWVVVELTDFPS